MTLKIGAKFEGKLTCTFKNGMKNFENVLSKMAWRILKIFTDWKIAF